jgi:hypothetical protein
MQRFHELSLSNMLNLALIALLLQGSFDNHHAVSRRIGFVPLPLACIVVRVLGQVLPWSGRPSGAMSSLAMWGWGALMLLLIWACLLALQGLLYIHLYAVCFRTSKSDKIEVLPANII